MRKPIIRFCRAFMEYSDHAGISVTYTQNQFDPSFTATNVTNITVEDVNRIMRFETDVAIYVRVE